MNNKIELIGYYGSDETIAGSAWTSTSRDITEEKRQRIPQLINQLWSNGHETPFEKGTVHFLIDCDIASHIHLLKHRMSSINAESARYKELKEDKYYLPNDWDGIINEDSTKLRSDHNVTYWIDTLKAWSESTNALYHRCLEELTPILGRKRAKESARYFKMYNSQIQSDIMFNMRSFANFLKLRNSEDAQKEIREIAQEMLKLVQSIEGNPFQHTLKAWGY